MATAPLSASYTIVNNSEVTVLRHSDGTPYTLSPDYKITDIQSGYPTGGYPNGFVAKYVRTMDGAVSIIEFSATGWEWGATPLAPANSYTSREELYNLDLNSDGTISILSTLIENDGTASLKVLGKTYYIGNDSPLISLKGYGGSDYKLSSSFQISWVEQSEGSGFLARFVRTSDGAVSLRYFTDTGALSSATKYAPASHYTSQEAYLALDLDGDGALTRENLGTASLQTVENSYYAFTDDHRTVLSRANGSAYELSNIYVITDVERYGDSGFAAKFFRKEDGAISLRLFDQNGIQTKSTAWATADTYTAREEIYNLDFDSNGVVSSIMVEQSGNTALKIIGNTYYAAQGSERIALTKADGTTYNTSGNYQITDVEKLSSGGFAARFLRTSDAAVSLRLFDDFGQQTQSTTFSSGSRYSAREPLYGIDLDGDGYVSLELNGSAPLKIANNTYFTTVAGETISLLKGATGQPYTLSKTAQLTSIEIFDGGGLAAKMVRPTDGFVSLVLFSGRSSGSAYSYKTTTMAPGSSYTHLEELYNLDLDGDGTIAITSSAIESDGNTTLKVLANSYYYIYPTKGAARIALTQSDGSFYKTSASSALTNIEQQADGSYVGTVVRTSDGAVSLRTFDSRGHQIDNTRFAAANRYTDMEKKYGIDIDADGAITLERDGSVSLLLVNNVYHAGTSEGRVALTRTDGSSYKMSSSTPVTLIENIDGGGYVATVVRTSDNTLSVRTFDSSGLQTSATRFAAANTYTFLEERYGIDLDGDGWVQNSAGYKVSVDVKGNGAIAGTTGNDVITVPANSGFLPSNVNTYISLLGESGNDTLTGHAGNNLLWGGPGDDTLIGLGQKASTHGDVAMYATNPIGFAPLAYRTEANGTITIFSQIMAGPNHPARYVDLYNLSLNSKGNGFVQDLEVTSTGDEGRDSLVGIETLSFSTGSNNLHLSLAGDGTIYSW